MQNRQFCAQMSHILFNRISVLNVSFGKSKDKKVPGGQSESCSALKGNWNTVIGKLLHSRKKNQIIHT